MDPIVGSGKYTYKVHEDWAHPPEGLEIRACAVSVDSKDRVYCFNRNPEHPVVIPPPTPVYPPEPTHPIVLPPPGGGEPQPDRKWEVKLYWTEEGGWGVALVPTEEHPGVPTPA